MFDSGDMRFLLYT